MSFPYVCSCNMLKFIKLKETNSVFPTAKDISAKYKKSKNKMLYKVQIYYVLCLYTVQLSARTLHQPVSFRIPPHPVP